MKRLRLNHKRVAKIQVKTEGSALLISVFLSGLMLTVGIMSARLAVQEAQMSADLFLSERAYLSAESGVERSLWLLKSEPLAHIEPTQDVIIGDADTTVSINNLIDTPPGNFPEQSFAFTLENLESQKFRFRHDNNNSPSTTESLITGPVQIDLNTPGSFFWRFLCQDPSNQTQSLQGRLNSLNTIGDLTSTNGKTDDGVDTTFNAWSGIEKLSCYLSIQNLSGDARTFTFSGTTMAPHAAHIHAVGVHRNREKHIRFDYAQKTLGALFDFSFLHSEAGL